MKPKSEKILVIDDEPGMCRLLKTVLEDARYGVSSFEKPAEALKTMEGDSFDLVITDIRMPRVNGMEVLKAVKTASPQIPVILITAHGTIDSAVQAMKLGASDYLTKPFKNDEIKFVVQNILEKQRLIEENKRLKAELASRYRFAEIVGKSSKMQQVFHLISQLAQSDVTVLIQGESGTGKEIVAKAIHFNSPRSARPFMVIHCGALPETLLESELFGHTKGAFTDALKDKRGLLESAEGGSVFLDEVGEMPPSMQVKFLRFLQDHEIRRLGSAESRKVDVRVIAATNKVLKEEVRRGRFREDLYYRLAVVPLHLPSLRERKEDIPLLVEHFLTRSSEKRKEKLSLAPEAFEILLNYDWPGNIRELENAIEHAVALCGNSRIGAELLPCSLALDPVPPGLNSWGTASYRQAKQKVLEAFEKTYLIELLKRSKDNITHAAQLAEMDRKNLYELLKKHGITPREESPTSTR
ncbi:MAG: sigma-54-dependent Fis family transcriptional regulator [Elusimicrobia bacterium]|nr:sigma-54-dependent Fis family transcriptional regulator [Elusimicrobiota bacterium]